jgi:hypothetical protein
MTRKRTAISPELTPDQRERLQLRQRWLTAIGDEMPGEISVQPLERIRRAVELVESGVHVFVPRNVVRECEASEAVSLREWDSESEF